MADLLKNLYSPAFYEKISSSFERTIPGFNKQKFLSAIFDDRFEHEELKERMKHTTRALHMFLPTEFGKVADLLQTVINGLRDDGFTEERFEFMFFPDYIETYGLDDFDNAVSAIEFVTQYVSCEFAVRPFLLRYETRMSDQMLKWSLHASASVRRLSSEGIRPRLPWAMAVPWLKKSPDAILPILENLKNDPSPSVRRSVANNLNDISKDHPEVVIRIAATWKGTSPETDNLIKHACRTLLKKGHDAILTHYSLRSKDLVVTKFSVEKKQINIGQHLSFSFTVSNQYKEVQNVRLEYAVNYRRANGSYSKKVFKISERMMSPGEKLQVRRQQSFKPITTKKFYPGIQKLDIIINGEEKCSTTFRLTG